MKHNYQSVSKATGATLITFSIFLIILDSTWIWMDWYLRNRCYRYSNNYYHCYWYEYFPMYSWTFGTGILCGILGLTAGSLGVSVAKNKEIVDFFAKFGPTAAMGNVAGSVAVVCYGYISFCVGMHLYFMEYIIDNVSWWNWAFFGSFIAVVICEWIFLTLVMALSFFQANFIGCTCCCKDPSESGAIEPVNEAAVPVQAYPAAPYQGYPQGQPVMMPAYGQPMPVPSQPMAAPYGQYAPYPPPKQVDESSSDSSDSSSDSDSD